MPSRDFCVELLQATGTMLTPGSALDMEGWLRIGYAAEDVDGDGSDRFMDGMVVWGDERTVRARVQEHLDAGADQVAVQPVVDHADIEAGDMSKILAALEALAPETRP